MLSQAQFDTLATVEGENLISIYLPTTPVGTEEQDRIRMKNAMQKAKQQLTDRGLAGETITEYLAKGNRLVEAFDFTNDSRHGLAIFIGPDTFETITLNVPVQETSVHIGNAFMVGNLTKELNADIRDFYLLTISRKANRLYLAEDGKLEEIETAGIVPQNLDEALLLKTPDRQLDRVGRSLSNGQGIIHGHGAGKDNDKEHLKAYFDEVDQGVNTLLKNEKRPLLLGGVSEMVYIYHDANKYNHLIKDVHIKGNCDDAPAHELYEKAVNLVAGHFNEQRIRDWDLFDLNMAKDEASANPMTIVPAAINGRVEVLWVAEDASQYGHYDADTNGIQLSDDNDGTATELYNLAVTRASQSGARVYVVPQVQLPRPTGTICAIFRYGIPAQVTNLSEETSQA